MTSIDPKGEKFFPLSPYSYVADNPILLNDPNGMDWSIQRDVDKDGVQHYHIVFTGAVVDETSDHKGQADKLAKALTSQFSKLFNESKDRDESGGTGFTVDTKVVIRAVGSEDDVATNETVFKVEDHNNADLSYTDDKGKTKEAAGKALNGKEIAVNEALVPDILSGDATKTITHEIGHTGGLRHPEDEKGMFGGAGNGLNRSSRNFMFSGGTTGDALNKNPTGPTKDQLYRIYQLYHAGQLNRKDVEPIYK